VQLRRSLVRSVLVLSVPLAAFAQDGEETPATVKRRDVVPCAAEGQFPFYTNPRAGLQHTSLQYEVGCPGRWSVWRVPVDGVPAETQCPIVVDEPGKRASCSPFLEAGETLVFRVSNAGDPSGVGVQWELEATP
jgi:hypothetical protein